MKVLVMGANDRIGKHPVLKLLNNNEHTVLAMVRKKEQTETFKQPLDRIKRY